MGEHIYKGRKLELLIPASSLEVLKIAVIYGADAVYLGGKGYGLRALGGNFSREELKEAVEFAHARGKKVYVTVNIFPHNSDLAGLPDYLRYLQSIKADALLVADLGVFSMCKKYIPDMELHISTQANNTNWATVNAWQALGAGRVVLAREMSLKEIQEIRAKCKVSLRCLFMAQCVFLTRDVVCYQTILRGVILIVAAVPNPAAGSMLWWKKLAQANIFLLRKMSVVLIL